MGILGNHIGSNVAVRILARRYLDDLLPTFKSFATGFRCAFIEHLSPFRPSLHDEVKRDRSDDIDE